MAPDGEFVEHPGAGRLFEYRGHVALADADTRGRCRLDALARLAQEAANADWVDAAPSSSLAWLVRSSRLRVREWPHLGAPLTAHTWSSGVGRRWAERRTTITSESSVAADLAAIWVAVDTESSRPARLPPEFEAHFVESTGGRKVDAKLRLDPPAASHARSWAVRTTDLDVIGHVNNTVYWQMAEEVATAAGLDLAGAEVVEATVEHRDPLETDAELRWTVDAGDVRWAAVGGESVAAVGSLRVR